VLLEKNLCSANIYELNAFFCSFMGV